MDAYTENLIKLTKMVFPEISDKDLQGFLYSKPETEPYDLGPDSKRQEGVPEGVITKYSFNDSNIYPGTERDYWVYVPSQYDAEKPACLMIFQDGMLYLYDPKMQANIALDNLIHKKEMPVAIGLFINSGDKGPGMPIYGGANNRSVEYDSTDDRYPRFLTEEMIPLLKKEYNITDDPKGIAIVGISSGGAAAFNAAWHRPDVFGRVICHCGSFVSIRGADKFPDLVRKTPAKPIKVFLQSGERDLNVVFGSWAIKNHEMAESLNYSGYDSRFEFGKGGHSMAHGGAIWPDTLRWLWSDFSE